MGQMKHINNAPGAPTPVGAYSQAVQVGELLFLAGQIAIDPATGAMIEGGVVEQTKQVLANIDAVLRHAGTSPAKIAMTSVFLTSISDAKQVNELYSSFVVPGAAPARQTFAVKDLPLGAVVEISVIAAV